MFPSAPCSLGCCEASPARLAVEALLCGGPGRARDIVPPGPLYRVERGWSELEAQAKLVLAGQHTPNTVSWFK